MVFCSEHPPHSFVPSPRSDWSALCETKPALPRVPALSNEQTQSIIATLLQHLHHGMLASIPPSMYSQYNTAPPTAAAAKSPPEQLPETIEQHEQSIDNSNFLTSTLRSLNTFVTTMTTTTTTTTTKTTTTQSGMVSKCIKFYMAVSGDSCYGIATNTVSHWTNSS